MSTLSENRNFYDKVVTLLESARNHVVRTANQTMVITYYEIGRMIVEEEQNGKDRAEYGKELLIGLASVLTERYGKGFSDTNLRHMRNFFLSYSAEYQTNEIQETVSPKFIEQIQQTLSAEFKNEKSKALSRKFILSWSHYLSLMRIDDLAERSFYEIEAANNNWSVRELKRQIDSALYTRLALSRDKDKVLELSKKGNIIEKPSDAIKEPYILEFLGLKAQSMYSESELEQQIIDKLEHFLLELGSGFTFVARQKRISFSEKHFYIDLVFYNRFLKSFVLIDLKIGELKHQDIGQMQMYVNYYDREIKLEDENKTIGIILCQYKDEAVVKYTLPEENEQIFASKYQTVLPTKEQLKSLLNSK